MSILTVVQNVAREIGLNPPSAVVGSSDLTAKQLLRYCYRAAEEMMDGHHWAELEKEHSITLVASEASYALPTDFDRHVFNTQWDQSNKWTLIGPLTPKQWQEWKNGYVQDGPRNRFRVKGLSEKQFFVDPTPDSGNAGDVLIFEYYSKQWLYPKKWEQNTAFGVGSYCHYGENIYKTANGGTTGTTAPTHTSGTVSDGGVSWEYQSDYYDTVLADSDVSRIDESTLELGILYRFLRQKGQPWQYAKQEFDRRLKIQASKLRGASTIYLGSRGFRRFIGPENIPDTGYGS